MSTEVAHDGMAQRVEQLAADLHARGFIVTRGLLVEAAGVAELLNVSEKTLRNWRCDFDKGPRVHSRRLGAVWYLIPDVLEWRDIHAS